MTGSISEPSIAVVAMVEPEMAENTVPATTATTASRPGRRRISRSMPSITFSASPVWNRISPISTNRGMGVSENAVTELTLLRASWARPGSPPMYSQAPTMLTVMKVRATGMPMNSSTVDPPSISQAAITHPVMRTPSCRAHGVVARAAFGGMQASHAEHHLDGQQHEHHGQRRQCPPLGRDQRLDVDGAGGIAG